ncbi:hypothetical protein A5886_000762 [Enterococcus sp. 8G7_MSG3316]|uniref:Septicolysin n=1 Tax=Candidatus Enterococcus testudinis TaxID=1834191 RepID=A0A242A3R6_9ENTE|nr:DIP1984 family protein [Enterococcus sp. 8G7_MSG3316]OTN75687.1 hypothetical protein A5886_000762 [Enterococcus sp. 8G7_MSG3316]
MKLAEALLLRRDLENRLHILRTEITGSVLVQEGDTLDRSVSDLLADYQQGSQQLDEIARQINHTNAHTTIVESSLLVVDALSQRERLRQSHALYTQMLDAAKAGPRMGRNEIRYVRTIDTKEITKLLNQTAQQLREIDGQIQQTNWLTDLSQ